MRRCLAVMVAAVLLLPACRRGASKAASPLTIKLEPAAYTYERDNRRSWVQTRATFTNHGTKPVRVAWGRLKATADAPMAGPTWQGDLPHELAPGETVTAAVAWYYVDDSHPRPQSLSITHRFGPGREVLLQKLPVKVIPTRGFAVKLSRPATAQLLANPYPRPGESWEVRAGVEIRNPTKGPLMLVPFWFRASAGSELVMHSGQTPAELNAVTRLDPGQTVRGTLVWRFRGAGPRPSQLRVVFPSPAEPDLADTIAVRAP